VCVIPDAEDDLLDVEAVAARLAVGPITIHRWCRDGRLRCLKPGRSWRIRRSDLDAFLQQSQRPQTLREHLERFLTVPDQVLTVAEDAALLTQVDAAFFQVGATRDALLVKFYDRRATSRSAQQAGLLQHGLDSDGLERRGRFRWCPETSLHQPLPGTTSHAWLKPPWVREMAYGMDSSPQQGAAALPHVSLRPVPLGKIPHLREEGRPCVS
jgi:excisionase family DNA binding protein